MSTGTPSAALSPTTARSRTGGPDDDRSELVEHIAGWVLVVVVAMLVTRLGLL
ncbi:SCO1431 family membrane protein [Streptomyces sp. NPDC000594]|uniref:SCO1431 family membrane protein n=1 Tax=Streptomyces sp. NPDC000594 TaxID=3154261 RepID=UPI0033165952